jgi:aspartate/methionine/tyrosine aminotransferase
MARRIPPSGINLFQLIYILIREYTQKTGQAPLNLSLGNPDGVPPQDLLDLQARFSRDPSYELHTYAEDKSLNAFVEGMVFAHSGMRLQEHPQLRATPIAGIKTATALLPLACGVHLPDRERRKSFRLVSNLPAYDVIGTWSSSYLATDRIVWPLLSQDNMRLNLSLLKEKIKDARCDRPDLIFVIRPGNPAAVGANEQDWRQLIEFCLERGSRLVNDGAYAGLVDSANRDAHVPLAQVAAKYPDLEWAELYSVSKSFNDPGARLGVMFGSQDLIDDYILIKGNTDSGPVPAVMAAYGEFFKNEERTRGALRELQTTYQRRLSFLVEALESTGMKKACLTDAGFFTLWKCPTRVFGKDLKSIAKNEGISLAEAANRTIIQEGGIVGVHFTGQNPDGSPDPLLRYAVCTDVLSSKFQDAFRSALERMKPEYT